MARTLQLQEDYRRLWDEAHVLSVPAEDVLYHQGAPAGNAYLLIDGRIRHERNIGGKRFILGHVMPVSVINMCTLIGSHGFHQNTARALDEARIGIIPLNRYRGWIKDNPGALFKQLVWHANQLSYIQKRLGEMAYYSVSSRLASTLRDLAELEEPDPDGRVKVEVNEHDLASLVGASRESIVRGMRDLKRQGLVETGRGLVVIHLEKLKRYLDTF